MLGEGVEAPIGRSKVTGHLLLDVKMDFTRKARRVFVWRKTPNPIGSTHAGAVSRDNIQAALTHAALSGLDVFASDIRSAHLQKPRAPGKIASCAVLSLELKALGRLL